MVGHYLLNLSTEQEDRVLTERLAEAPWYVRDDGCRCLVGVVMDRRVRGFFGSACSAQPMWGWWGEGSGKNKETRSVGHRFDDLCRRFGETRVNAAIRLRILNNRTRRVLDQPQEAICLVTM